MYVILGIGSKAVGETPEEAADAFEAMGGRGPVKLIRTPESVTRATIDDDLRAWHSLEPARTAADDAWVELEPGSALRARTSVWWAAAQPPRTVPGFQAAVDSGVVRLPPEVPPRALPGLPANVLGLSDVALFGAFFVVVVMFRLPVPVIVILFAGCFGWSFLTSRLLPRRRDAELDAGYITLPVAKVQSRQSSEKDHWDFRGTWVLRWNGEVKSAPDRSLDAPGFYPSPSPVQAGRLQRWSGAEWLPEFREPEQQQPRWVQP